MDVICHVEGIALVGIAVCTVPGVVQLITVADSIVGSQSAQRHGCNQQQCQYAAYASAEDAGSVEFMGHKESSHLVVSYHYTRREDESKSLSEKYMFLINGQIGDFMILLYRRTAVCK